MKKKEPVNDLGENGPESRGQGGATPGIRGKVDGQTPSPVCGQPSTQCQSTGIGVRNQTHSLSNTVLPKVTEDTSLRAVPAQSCDHVTFGEGVGSVLP